MRQNPNLQMQDALCVTILFSQCMTQFQFQLSIGSVGHSGLFLFDPLVEAVTGIQYSLSGKGERRTSTRPVENNQPAPAWTAGIR